MTPVNKASGLSPLIPIPWAALRAWLDAAEQGQAASGGATRHLAHSQLLALSQLVSFCAEPPVPKEDHVSKLMRMSSAPLAAAAAVAATPMEGVQYANGETCGPEFSQGHRLEPPSFEMSDPVDVPFKGVFQLRWHCECVLPWCSERFPKREEGKPPAFFSNKKDAKQYAAMQAVAYLTSGTKEMATSHTPRTSPPPPQTPQLLPPQHLPPPQPTPQPQQRPQKQPQRLPPSQPAPQQPLMLPTPTRPRTPPIAMPVPEAAAPCTPPSVSSGSGGGRPKRRLDSPNADSSHRESPLKQRQQQQHRTPSPGPTTTPPPVPFVSPPPGRGGDAAAEQQRLFDGIRRLSLRLGVSQPQYRLTQDRPNFFSGRAEFPPASRVPDDIGVVADVLGKRQARIQIAAKVLAWMEREEARRQALSDGVLE